MNIACVQDSEKNVTGNVNRFSRNFRETFCEVKFQCSACCHLSVITGREFLWPNVKYFCCTTGFLLFTSLNRPLNMNAVVATAL